MTDYPDYILEAYDVIEKLLSPQERIYTRNAAMSDALHNALLRIADKAVEDYKAEQEDIKGSMAKAQHTTTTLPQDCL